MPTYLNDSPVQINYQINIYIVKYLKPLIYKALPTLTKSTLSLYNQVKV